MSDNSSNTKVYRSYPGLPLLEELEIKIDPDGILDQYYKEIHCESLRLNNMKLVFDDIRNKAYTLKPTDVPDHS